MIQNSIIYKSGGGNLQSKTSQITTNGRTVIKPDSGYDGLKRVTVIANIKPAQTQLQYLKTLDLQETSETKLDGIALVDGADTVIVYGNETLSGANKLAIIPTSQLPQTVFVGQFPIIVKLGADGGTLEIQSTQNGVPVKHIATSLTLAKEY